MPKPKIKKPKTERRAGRDRRAPLATDHRATVLESVATYPGTPTAGDVARDCATTTYTRRMVLTMVDTLSRQGLIGRTEQNTFVITEAGLDYLAKARFDRAIADFTPRPGSRKRRAT